MKLTATFIMAIVFAVPSAVALAECKTNLPFHKANRFVDNQDGTVTDTLTNLIWMRCPLGQNWKPTESLCEIPYEQGSKRMDIFDTWNRVMVETENLNLTGGYASATDWRVPNIKELASISMLHCYPPIDATAFPFAKSTSTGAKQFWSSTPSRKFETFTPKEDTSTKEYRTQAWSFSIVDARNAGKALEVATGQKHNVLLVRGDSRQANQR